MLHRVRWSSAVSTTFIGFPGAVVYMSTYALRSNEDNDFNSILQQLMARDMRQVAYGSMICRGPE